MMSALPAISDQGDRVINDMEAIIRHGGRLQNTKIPVLKIANLAAVETYQMGMQSDIGIEMSFGCTAVYLPHQP
jgi:hypothetical protein